MRRDLYGNRPLCKDLPSARGAWSNYRKTNSGKALVKRLEDMAGPTTRCFYCGDSRGAEVDHFVPIEADYSATFRWSNMLLSCGPCNRSKGKTPVTAGLVR